MQAAAFALEGHPIAAFNGTYRPQGQHEGWPRFENEHGRHLYRYRPDERWFLERAFTPESDIRNAYIAAAEGPIPTGAQRWQCYVNGKWEERTVTVTALVSALRRCLHSPLGADTPGLAVPYQPHIAETVQWGGSFSSDIYLHGCWVYYRPYREEGIVRAGSARYPVRCGSLVYALEPHLHGSL